MSLPYDPLDAPSPPPALTAGQAWALWAAVGVGILFVLACVAIAFDVPALRQALDVRSLFD